MQEDTRNVIDKFKGVSNEEIVRQLDENAHGLEVAIENLEHDFNIGTVVRNANAFGVRHVHIIGKKQWNKRGAMVTNRYLHVHHWPTVEVFAEEMKRQETPIYAIDNIPGSVELHTVKFPETCVLVFGAEGPGISPELASHAELTVAIEQFGSTRSVNVGVASGIAMYAWLTQHKL